MRQIYSPLDGFRSPFGRLMGGTPVPSNAIRDRAGNPILDRFGAFILTRS